MDSFIPCVAIRIWHPDSDEIYMFHPVVLGYFFWRIHKSLEVS